MFLRFKGQAVIALILIGTGATRVFGADVDVTKGSHISFGVSGFGGDASIAGQVTDVLKNDLRLSGYFSLTPVGGAKYVQSGAVRGDRSGVVIECVVMQQDMKRVILSKTYQGSGQDLRRADLHDQAGGQGQPPDGGHESSATEDRRPYGTPDPVGSADGPADRRRRGEKAQGAVSPFGKRLTMRHWRFEAFTQVQRSGPNSTLS